MLRNGGWMRNLKIQHPSSGGYSFSAVFRFKHSRKLWCRIHRSRKSFSSKTCNNSSICLMRLIHKEWHHAQDMASLLPPKKLICTTDRNIFMPNIVLMAATAKNNGGTYNGRIKTENLWRSKRAWLHNIKIGRKWFTYHLRPEGIGYLFHHDSVGRL